MLQVEIKKQTLNFNFPGGTSRGVLTSKPSWYIKVYDEIAPELFGIGEVSLIPGLSLEDETIVEESLNQLVSNPFRFITKSKDLLKDKPAIKFGLETALLDLQNGGKRILYPSEFTDGQHGIEINGLVWMGSKDEMYDRIKEKIDAGYKCIKIKVGAINFQDELDLLQFIRSKFSKNDLELRVDANGAFKIEEALEKLEQLSKFDLHSIEQPIKQKQIIAMANLCNKSPLAIALDEELIGVEDEKERKQLLDNIKPQYIVIKPSLVGGLADTMNWAQVAEQNQIGWWITSALEGNIGLNAIAQWTAIYGSKLPQGLGTGQVFSNNIESPLEIRGRELWYNSGSNWEVF